MESDSNNRFRTRLATDDDLNDVIAVCAAALGWAAPAFDSALFYWKHISNAFGRSLILVATDTQADDKIVAVRTFMRWRFIDADGSTVDAARAVDTATLPEAQGNGLFRQLTLAGLAMLEDEGCGFVFNTPNSLSLPGYLKMGWFPAGRVEFGFGVPSVRSLPRLAKSRTAANKPSIDTPMLGLPAGDGLAQIVEPIASNPTAKLRTAHTLETLQWRYANGPVTYRYLPFDPSSGLVVRLRQRGEIRELLVAEQIGVPNRQRLAAELRAALRLSGANVVVAPAGSPRTIPVRAIGPKLALRTVTVPVTPGHFGWTPGDIELF